MSYSFKRQSTPIYRALFLILTIAICLTSRPAAAQGDLSVAFTVPYQVAAPFSEGLALVQQQGKWGYIDRTGKNVIACAYDQAMPFAMGLAVVANAKLCGLIDKTGKLLVPCEYDAILPFKTESFTLAKKGRTYYFIDKTGRILPGEYTNALAPAEGLAWASNDDFNGFIDRTGDKVIKLRKGDIVNSFSGGFTNIINESGGGMIDRTGKTILFFDPVSFVKQRAPYSVVIDSAMGVKEIWASAPKNGYFILSFRNMGIYGRRCAGLYNTSGRGLSDFYLSINDVYDSRAATQDLSEKWGYISEAGKPIGEFKYTECANFSNDRGKVKLDGKVGYVDLSGYEVVKPIYDNGYDFKEGMAKVISQGKCGFINKSGEVVIPIIYDASENAFNGNYVMVMKDKKFGLISKTGKVVIPVECEYLFGPAEGLIPVRKQGVWSYLKFSE